MQVCTERHRGAVSVITQMWGRGRQRTASPEPPPVSAITEGLDSVSTRIHLKPFSSRGKQFNPAALWQPRFDFSLKSRNKRKAWIQLRRTQTGKPGDKFPLQTRRIHLGQCYYLVTRKQPRVISVTSRLCERGFHLRCECVGDTSALATPKAAPVASAVGRRRSSRSSGGFLRLGSYLQPS